jgi:hypothetical protein
MFTYASYSESLVGFESKTAESLLDANGVDEPMGAVTRRGGGSTVSTTFADAPVSTSWTDSAFTAAEA